MSFLNDVIIIKAKAYFGLNAEGDDLFLHLVLL